MTPIEKVVYAVSVLVCLPFVLALIVKAWIKAFNDIVDTGSRKDRPDGFNGLNDDV
jgi:hypothetical protein